LERTIVVALGGNAILKAGQAGTLAEQMANVEESCRHIAKLILGGYRVVITHGNGPQVGNILLQNEEASGVVPAMPLDACGAESQGLIGYMIQQSLANELARVGREMPVVSLVTQVIVDADDPAFARPTKPIGPFYTEARARRLMEQRGFKMVEDAGRGWRRVVPSPDPRAIVEREVILRLVAGGSVVVASGGGGIPVVRREGELVGVEAVIDKDLAGERLAVDVGADTFLILTDVPRVALNFGRPDQRPIVTMTYDEGRQYQKEGHFRAGSMGPKVEAALRFVAEGPASSGEARRAIIAALDQADLAVQGKAGTEVVRG